MIDSIGSSANAASTERMQASLPASRLRSTEVLTAVQQSQQKNSGAVAPVRVFAVPQTANADMSSMAKLPRGSLVDVLV